MWKTAILTGTPVKDAIEAERGKQAIPKERQGNQIQNSKEEKHREETEGRCKKKTSRWHLIRRRRVPVPGLCRAIWKQPARRNLGAEHNTQRMGPWKMHPWQISLYMPELQFGWWVWLARKLVCQFLFEFLRMELPVNYGHISVS